MNQEAEPTPRADEADEDVMPVPPPETARRHLERLLELMGFEGQVEVFEQTGGNLLLHVETPEAAQLIGRHAQVLDALQYILNRLMFAAGVQHVYCTVDVERYRERHRDRLLQEAFSAADEVRRTGRAVRLKPMPAADRRVIHQALKDHRDVRTVSEETDQQGMKRVVVRPAHR